MKDDLIRKFLNGDASDQEFTYCESLLEAKETVVEEDDWTGDSLVSSLRSHDRAFDPESEEARTLTARIESLIDRQAIGREDLERVLDPPILPDELGRIGKYRILEFIAAGGMGLVFKGEDTELHRTVCIKVLHPALGMKSEAKIRFERESRAAAKLRSERIVTLLDVGTQRDLPYFVMQLLEGESLRSRLNRIKQLDTETATRFLMQIAEGLRHAHELGIIHRDIKPDNIWITVEEDIKLLDFGLARTLDGSVNLTTSGGIIGTPHYMSPEQIQGESIDARSDLFSVGIVLYEMLTGELPFQRSNLLSTMMAIANDPIVMPSGSSDSTLPQDVTCLLSDLLKKSPEDRPQSANEVIERLQLKSMTSDPKKNSNELISKTKGDSRRGKQGIGWRIWLGVAAGMGAAFFGMFLFEQQNKGTLVVRTSDSSVEVKIAHEKVTVQDPLTGKQYEIRIGDTPLPSGVYQLEMNDASGSIQFSSSTIAIRRGKKTIVDVELKPAMETLSKMELLDSKDPDKRVEGMNAGSMGPGEKSIASSVDRSYDLAARQNFGKLLNALPALSLEDFAPRVDSKSKLIPGLTIASTDIPPSQVVYNSDHSLVAAAVEGFVKIWDASGELKHLIPVQKRVSKILFDNEHPNLLAINLYNLQPHEIKTEGENPHTISIWRLQSDRAERLAQFESSSYDMVWDHGYRLAYYRSKQFAIFRVDLGKSFDVPGPSQEMLRSFSPDGHFIATIPPGAGGQVSIHLWDLHQGVFAYSLLNGTEVSWSADSERVAIFPYAKSICEIWGLKTKKLLQTVELPEQANQVNWGGNNPGRSAAIDMKLDPNLDRLAWLTLDGNLVVRNLQTNRQQQIQVPNAARLDFAGKLRWTSDGAILVGTKKQTFRWTSQESEVQGTFVESKQPWIQSVPESGRFEFRQAFGSAAANPILSWALRKGQNANLDSPDPQKINRFNLLSNSILSEVTLDSQHKFSTSPDGKQVVVMQLDPKFPSSFKKSLPLDHSLASLVVPNTIFPLGKHYNTASFVWTTDGHYVATRGRKRPSGVMIVNTENFGEQKELSYDSMICGLDNGFALLSSSETAKSKWLFQILKIDERQGLAPSSQETSAPPPVARELPSISASLSEFELIDTASVQNNELIVGGFTNNAGTINQKGGRIKSITRIPLDRPEPIPLVGIKVYEPNPTCISPSGQFVLQRSGSNLFITRWSDDANRISSQDENESLSTSSFSKKLIEQEGNDFRNMQWHSKKDVAFWTSYGIPYFYDTERNILKSEQTSLQFDYSIVDPVQSALATEYGWLLCHGTELLFYDHVGNRLGRLVFDSVLTDGLPTNPRWILADGSTSTHGSKIGLHVSYRQGSSLHTEALESFSKSHAETPLPTFEDVPFLKPALTSP